MTYQKLYTSHFICYEKQIVDMFDHIMLLKLLERSTSKKVDLETQGAKLNCDVSKLCFQLRQKITHGASLRHIYLAEKTEGT